MNDWIGLVFLIGLLILALADRLSGLLSDPVELFTRVVLMMAVWIIQIVGCGVACFSASNACSSCGRGGMVGSEKSGCTAE